MVAGSLGLIDQPLFSLGGCSDLSELGLGVESTDSRIVTTSADILSNLDPIQRNRLRWISLAMDCIYRWLCVKSRIELTRA